MWNAINGIAVMIMTPARNGGQEHPFPHPRQKNYAGDIAGGQKYV